MVTLLRVPRAEAFGAGIFPVAKAPGGAALEEAAGRLTALGGIDAPSSDGGTGGLLPPPQLWLQPKGC